MALTNATLWNDLRKWFPTFRQHTAEATAELFTENGFEALKRTDPNAINEFFELSTRVGLIGIETAHAKDTLSEKGFGEYFDQPFGAIIQKMAINSIKPISPAYRNLKNGDSPDPGIVRKPVVSERFFKQNFDYASLVTMPDDFQKKTIFISEYGMSEFTAGIMEGLQNGYTAQVYLNKLEALNKGINSTAYPLKDTQKFQVSLSAEPTADELVKFIIAMKKLASSLEMGPMTGAYNAMGYETTQRLEDMKMLIRPGYKEDIQGLVLANAFQEKNLNLPFGDPIEVPNFGGIEYYTDSALTKRAYPAFNSIGEQIGFNDTEGTNVAKYQAKDLYTKDPNEKVIAMIADRRYIFEARQNPYQVEPWRNPRGLYTNYWVSSPGNTIAVDPLYNMIIVTTA